jgi:hypothetical protein
MAYGVNANGYPIADDGGQGEGGSLPNAGAEGQANHQCGAGQKWNDISQQCEQTYQTQGQPAPLTPPTPPATNPTPQKFDTSTDWSNPATVSAYYQSRGVTPAATSPDYWAGKYNEFGRNDPNYFMKFLSNAEEFTGGAAQTAKAMGFQGAPGGGAGPTVNPMQSFLAGQPAPFQPGQTPTVDQTNYNPTQFRQPTQYQADPTQSQTGNLIAQLLANPAMSPAVVAQMKAGQQDTITSAAQAARQNILQSAAQRGTTMGGNTGAQLGGVDMATLGDLSKAYRDIDVNAAQTNFGNSLGAIGASGQFQSQLLDQYLKQAGVNLNVDQAQAGENQFAANFGRQQGQDKLNNYLADQGFKMNANQQAFMQWLQTQGLSLSKEQLAEAARQFNVGNGLDVAKFLAS